MKLSRAQITANHARVRAEADAITQRLLTGGCTVEALRKEYAVGPLVIRDVYYARTTARQRHQAWLSKLSSSHGFKSGFRPWNAGMKGWKPKGSEKGHFKKGCLRAGGAQKYLPVGTVCVRMRHGRRVKFLKVSDVLPLSRRWIPLAKFVWEKANGPIPRGFVLEFVDSHTSNVVLSNLRLASRSRHLRAENMSERSRRRQRISLARLRQNKHDVRAFRAEKLGPVVEVWECGGCGDTVSAEGSPEKCGKCQGRRFDRVKRRAA